FDYDGSFGFTKMLEDQGRGINNSWSCRWHASAFLKDMYTLYPRRSLVKNIGFDGTGTHGGTNDIYAVDLYPEPISVDRIPVGDCEEERKAVTAFHTRAFGPTPVWHRVGRRLKSVGNRLVGRAT